MPTPQSRIRNFSIIAHIDHGKSTLADRILEITGSITDREMRAQFLDKMDIERERGITIKAQTVRLAFKAKDGQLYELNLIDTPGHVDFNYEVSRSLAACEGAILVVDSTQGVEAQTLANVYLAVDQGLEILPVLNKIDLPSSDVEGTKAQIEQVVGLDTSESIACSGKTGAGVVDILEQIVQKVPHPRGKDNAPLRALVFDSWYDTYRGAVAMVRVVDGNLKKGDKVRFLAAGTDYEVLEMGLFTPFAVAIEELGPGEVGFVAANIRSVHDVKLGRHGHARDQQPQQGRPPHGPHQGAAAGLQGRQAHGLRGRLPDRQRGLPQPARRHGEAAPQRRGLQLRARRERGAGVRVPLRIPGPAPHGDHPGAARARVQPRPHHHGAERRLQRLQDRRHHGARREPGEAAAPRARRAHRGAAGQHDHPRAQGVRGTGARALPGAARNAEGHAVRLRGARHRDLRAAVRRGAVRLPRQAQEHLARLRVDGLRGHRVPGRHAGEGRHPRQRRAARRASASSCTATRARRAGARWRRS